MRWKPNKAVAIVTGASSGIGRCLCELLVKRGSTVIAVARRRERLEALTADIGQNDLDVGNSGRGPTGNGRIVPFACDIVDADKRAELIQFAESIANGRLDLIVNNAGSGAIGPFEDATPARLREIMEVNFFAPVELIRLALPSLRKGNAPVICNVGSVLGHRAVPNKSEYCASKFAIHGFSDSLRAELAPSGIQVTLVSPSTTRSEFFDSLIDTDPNQQSTSVGSWSPERVARTTLASIQARRSEVILSLGGKALVYADRFAPPLMNAILAKSRRSAG